MNHLRGIERDLIYVLAGMEGPHGLALMDELEDYYEDEINPGRLYPNLDSLVEKGLVTKQPVDKRTNRYDLTDRGYREIEDRAEWEAQYVDSP